MYQPYQPYLFSFIRNVRARDDKKKDFCEITLFKSQGLENPIHKLFWTDEAKLWKNESSTAIPLSGMRH